MDKAKNELLKTKEELFRVVRKYAKKDPSKTYSSIEEVRNFLQQYADHPIKSPTDYIESLDLNSVSMLLQVIKEDYAPKGEEPPKPKEEEKEEEKPVTGEIVEKGDMLPVPTEKPTGALAVVDEESMGKVMALMEKVHELAMARIKKFPPEYFVIFGDNVCLVGKGIDKFLAGLPLPIELRNTQEMPVEEDKAGYPIYRFRADAVNVWTGMSIPVYSEERSNKGFYTARKGGKLAPDQVNLRDVRVASFRGLRKEAVKLFFGMRGLSKKEAGEMGIPTGKIKVAK